MKTTFLSKKGFKDLKNEIARLENEEKLLSAKVKELGKAHSREERFEFNEMVARRDNASAELGEKRLMLKSAKMMPRKRDRLYVAIGSVVDLVDQQGRLMSYTLVNSFEANPLDGRISDKSPLGQSLLGRQVSDVVEVDLAKKSRQLTLVSVR